mmetsp:Transcript_90963/g.253155  ORF Transcript_90963/g.253155 Transcript_90963/m.253155 type:complete len:223 (-) Transcript_90963:1725-2393(-)
MWSHRRSLRQQRRPRWSHSRWMMLPRPLCHRSQICAGRHPRHRLGCQPRCPVKWLRGPQRPRWRRRCRAAARRRGRPWRVKRPAAQARVPVLPAWRSGWGGRSHARWAPWPRQHLGHRHRCRRSRLPSPCKRQRPWQCRCRRGLSCGQCSRPRTWPQRRRRRQPRHSPCLQCLKLPPWSSSWESKTEAPRICSHAQLEVVQAARRSTGGNSGRERRRHARSR